VGRGGATLSLAGPHGPVAVVNMRTRAVGRPAPAPAPPPARSAAVPAHGHRPWAFVALGLVALAALAGLLWRSGRRRPASPVTRRPAR